MTGAIPDGFGVRVAKSGPRAQSAADGHADDRGATHSDEECQQAGRAIREACLETVADGTRTADLGGYSATSEFTDEVIRRTRTKLDVWSTL